MSVLPSTEKVSCRICNDAGWVHPVDGAGKPIWSETVPCICGKEEAEALRDASMLKYCELPFATEHMTFEGFKKRPGTDAAYNAALQFAEEKSDVKWLTLMSGVDRGKTHLAIAICRRWLARGKVARYIYVPLLLDELRRGYGPRNDDDSYDRKLELLLNVSLLVLDDLGAEYNTPWAQEKLEIIVDHRCVNGLALVVTTNKKLSAAKREEALPPRIASRLQRFGEVVVLTAGEYRLFNKGE